MKFIKNLHLKRFFLLLFLLILFIIVSAFSYVNAISSHIADNLFRLHVIANSNEDFDQNLKYIVRDSIIEYINTLSQNLNSKEEIIASAQNNIKEIQKIAQKTIYENGYNYSANVEIGNFNFPTKKYGDISLPAGFYDALKIEIGEAKGENWWCVMFPPLCFVDTTSGIVPDSSKEFMKENLSEEEFRLISENSTEMQFKFKVVEVFNTFSANLTNS